MKKNTQSKKTELRGVVDDGTRKIPIYNTFGRLICNIYLRPADLAILDRFKKMENGFQDVIEPLRSIQLEADGTATFDKDWEVLKAVEEKLKKEINTLFDMEEADEIFATRNPFSSVNGAFFVENILTTIGEIIKEAVTKEAELSAARINKYLDDLPTDGSGVDAGDAAAKS